MGKFEPMKMRGHKGFTLVEIVVVLAVIGLLAVIAIPNFIRARERAQTDLCISNLKHIDDAKSVWAMEAGAQPTDEVVWGNLVPGYLREVPTCPESGTYTLGTIADYPTCSVNGHELKE